MVQKLDSARTEPFDTAQGKLREVRLPSEKEERKKQERQAFFRTIFLEKHLHMSVKIAAVTISSIAIFGGGGYLLDKKFDTSPILLIAGLSIGFPITQIVLIKVLKNFVKNQENSCQDHSKSK